MQKKMLVIMGKDSVGVGKKFLIEFRRYYCNIL